MSEKRRHVVRFSDVAERPSLSLNRGFSAPITLSVEQTREDRAFLARHDSDPFSRWQAFNSLLTDALMAAFRQGRGGKPPEFPGELVGLAGVDRRQRNARAGLPGAGACIARRSRHRTRDRHQHRSRCHLCRPRGARDRRSPTANDALFEQLFAALESTTAFSPDAASAGRRALRNMLLDYLAAGSRRSELAPGISRDATNMTDRAAALTVLAHRHREAEPCKATRWPPSKNATAPTRWSSTSGSMIQATIPGAATVERVESADAASGLLHRQPEPRARADRHLRERQPDRIPPRRRRRLPAVRRHRAGRSKSAIRSLRHVWRRRCGPGVRWSRCGRNKAREALLRLAGARTCRPICATSSSARWHRPECDYDSSAIFGLFAGRLWTSRITFDSLWMIRMCGVAGSSTENVFGRNGNGRSGRVERARWLDFCPA